MFKKKKNQTEGVYHKKTREEKYDLVINHGLEEGYEHLSLEKKEFLNETSRLFNKPKKIFLGMGDFLEVGDYSKLLDSIFYDEGSVHFEKILDKNNRKIAEMGNIPFSFFKLAVYYPEFLLKEVPTYCTSVIGKKSRLFPGAEMFIRYVKEYDPMILSAMPYEIAIELVKRLDLDDEHLISTEYKLKQNEMKKDVYAGDVVRFISGDRKSLEIEKHLGGLELTDRDIVYIGRGEAGAKTFSHVNSIAFNPSRSIVTESSITLYGSSLESLLVLFNFEGEIDRVLSSADFEPFLPSLVVFSEKKEKSEELINLEMEHLLWQSNIIGQRIERAGESYTSVEREIEVTFGGSFIDMKQVRNMISRRMSQYRENPQELVKEIYHLALQRYKNFCTV